MRIIQINAVNGILSTGVTCSELSEFMRSRGNTCYTLYSTGKEDEYSIKVGIPIEAKLHGALSRITGLQGYYSYFTTLRILHYLKQLKPDVVHLRNLHSNNVNLRILLNYLGRNDIPTVVTLHDCWFYTGKCTYYAKAGCEKWLSGCGSCPRLKYDNKSYIFDFTHKMWRDKKKWFKKIPRLAVIGVSDWITSEGKRSFLGEHALICKRIYNWIDLKTFRPKAADSIKEEIGAGGKKIVLGIASFWDERKGLDLFIRLSEYLDEDSIIVIVGNVPARCIFPDNIIHLPLISDRNKLADIYSAAEVFVQMSKEETFGKVTAEALSCGTPVVSNSHTANPELVGEGCGYIADSFEEITCSIKEILCNGKEQYSERCRAFAEINFERSNNSEEYLKLYRELISDQSGFRLTGKGNK